MERERRKDIASDLRFPSSVATPVYRHGEREMNAFRQETNRKN
jgi:hypothetical protein